MKVYNEDYKWIIEHNRWLKDTVLKVIQHQCNLINDMQDWLDYGYYETRDLRVKENEI